jgi:hypothetical protein
MDKITLERLNDDDWNILQRQKLFQLSSETLIKLSKCCGSKCINYPYEPKHTPNNDSVYVSPLS